MEHREAQDKKRKDVLKSDLDNWVIVPQTTVAKPELRIERSGEYLHVEVVTDPKFASIDATDGTSTAPQEDYINEQKDELNVLEAGKNDTVVVEDIPPKGGDRSAAEIEDSDTSSCSNIKPGKGDASESSADESESCPPTDVRGMERAIALMKDMAPSGVHYEDCIVKTKIPHLLCSGTLREYQHIGLDWLVNLHENSVNGILADEMGLGKTIEIIALLAYLASEEENWGPHLIVAPISTLKYWEMEFKKWLPSLKVLVYCGSAKERKLKRKNWSRQKQFHVCISSYDIAVLDHRHLCRKKWEYLILDESHYFRNFQSKKWQVLLKLKTTHRLLISGTPRLPNTLAEFWTLMNFLMPSVFQSEIEFHEWFTNRPLAAVNDTIEKLQDVESNELIERIHNFLRPLVLRRLKRDIAKF